MKNVKISVVKFKDCWAVYSSDITRLRFDGKEAEQRFNGWYFIDPDPKKITYVFDSKHGDKFYVLKDAFKKLTSMSIPHEFHSETVETGKIEYSDDDKYGEICVWKEEFQHLRLMYEIKYDIISGGEEEVEPEFSFKADVDFDYRDPRGVKFPIGKNREITSSEVIRPTLVESVMFPEVVTKTL